MKNNNLISEYRNADCQHRLCMYMETPALRDIFLEIDINESITVESTSNFFCGNKFTIFLLKAYQFFAGNLSWRQTK